MSLFRVSALALTTVILASPSSAHSSGLPETPGALVALSVQVGGRTAPLYPARDGSGRYYLQACEGAPYLIRLSNRSGERLGVVLTVDGLNVISGAPDQGRGRMYVLDPHGSATVRGWRTSLREVRRFTFVDEEVSYAARTGQSSSRMGWVEMSVYRERTRWTRPRPLAEAPVSRDRGRKSSGETRSPEPTTDAAEPEARPTEKTEGSFQARSYPGTGWGSPTHDRAVLVEFEPERSPSQRTTLRYEYLDALVALGVLPPVHAPRDRLAERDRGEGGFAPPPLW
jgi:hypothetical protein